MSWSILLDSLINGGSGDSGRAWQEWEICIKKPTFLFSFYREIDGSCEGAESRMSISQETGICEAAISAISTLMEGIFVESKRIYIHHVVSKATSYAVSVRSQTRAER